MKPNNIFRNAQGEPINQFVGDANGYDCAIEQMKRHGVYINKDTWREDIPIIIQHLRCGEDGWLCFISID